MPGLLISAEPTPTTTTRHPSGTASSPFRPGLAACVSRRRHKSPPKPDQMAANSRPVQGRPALVLQISSGANSVRGVPEPRAHTAQGRVQGWHRLQCSGVQQRSGCIGAVGVPWTPSVSQRVNDNTTPPRPLLPVCMWPWMGPRGDGTNYQKRFCPALRGGRAARRPRRTAAHGQALHLALPGMEREESERGHFDSVVDSSLTTWTKATRAKPPKGQFPFQPSRLSTLSRPRRATLRQRARAPA